MTNPKKNIVFVIGQNFFSIYLIKKIISSNLNKNLNVIIFYSKKKNKLKNILYNLILLNPINIIEIFYLYLKYSLKKISVIDVNSNKFINFVNRKKTFLVISLMCDQIFKKKTIEKIKCDLVNFHPGLIPKYCGLYPNFYSILNNEKYFGITFHKIDEKIDHGQVLKIKKFKNKLLNNSIYQLAKKLYFNDKTIKFIVECITNYKELKKKTGKNNSLYKKKRIVNSFPSIGDIIKYKFNYLY